MPSLNSAAAARRWSEAPGRRSIAPRASDDDDWEKLFKDLKPLAPDLSAAQLEVLERALAKGRRQVPIVAIAKELELSRDEVLAWVKSNASRVPELAKQYPPDPYEKVATVRLTERPEVDRREGRAPRGYDDDANYDSQTSYLKNAPGAKHVPKGMPAYKAYTKTRLGSNNVATLENGEIKTFEVTPEDAGLGRVDGEALKGSDADANAIALSSVLQGKPSAYRDVALLNAAAALIVAGRARDLKEGVAIGAQSLDSGAAAARLKHLVAVSNS